MKKLAFILSLLFILIGSSAWAISRPKLFQTACVRIGGNHMAAADVQTLGNFDIALESRFHYSYSADQHGDALEDEAKNYECEAYGYYGQHNLDYHIHFYSSSLEEPSESL